MFEVNGDFGNGADKLGWIIRGQTLKTRKWVVAMFALLYKGEPTKENRNLIWRYYAENRHSRQSCIIHYWRILKLSEYPEDTIRLIKSDQLTYKGLGL